jgi:dUTP pyrophosphatase
MNIINYGGMLPSRKHPGDAGADVYCLKEVWVQPHETVCIGLGFGTEIPDGHVGFILPRSSMAKRGLVAQTVPVDSNYRGEIHAIITNYGDAPEHIEPGDRIAQLVVVPCLLEEFAWILPGEASKTDRGVGAFGSTGR